MVGLTATTGAVDFSLVFLVTSVTPEFVDKELVDSEFVASGVVEDGTV
jgi:hypothetical protein